MDLRLFIEKKNAYTYESQKVLKELQNLGGINSLKIYQIYDIFGINKEDLKTAIDNVFTNPVTDLAHQELILKEPYIGVEFLPGQYDQRADSAEQCLQLLGIEDVRVITGQLFVFDSNTDEDTIAKLKNYLINPIEKRLKDLNLLILDESSHIKPVPIIEDFINFDKNQLVELHKEFGFSMGDDDLIFIQNHFKTIQRNPTDTELKVLDTYWSDHCRHTTFETELTAIKIESPFKHLIDSTLAYYLDLRKQMNITKPVRLMDMATIMGKYLSKNGDLTNIEVSEEVNACSVVIKVDEDGTEEDWLLMFKNETHNHPTEVDPYGGASTCVGGAIRDPLSGRSYVYQAMRVTGCANPLEKIEDTLEGKLPQRKITTQAAKGYAGYGNQIGLATTHVREIYHEGYKAKRMEVGFVAGAVKKDWVRRESPTPGDIIILLGGRTGRDGIGGATGSSKVHDGQKLADLSAEVQKGNAPVERKIQRLFRKEEVVRMIKKCNDFGAGGVSVAIGEIADGVKINIDVLPVKYNGLNGTELAISESQERMAVVIEPHNVERFIALADQENLEATEVALVTDDNTMTVEWRGTKIVELDRTFLDTNGVRKTSEIHAIASGNTNPFEENKTFNEEKFLALLKELNHSSQKGMIEMFDSIVGRGTVLMPMGGVYQDSMEDVSVQKLPTEGFTNTASMASWGFNPLVSEWSCYHGGYFAVIDSVTKLVAAGVKYQDIRLTFQEYFERLGTDYTRWAKPFEALLGTIEVQKELGIAAIGGKDSMSGSYHEIDVPPTLISFAVAPVKVNGVKGLTFQKRKANIYLFTPELSKEYTLDFNQVRKIYDDIHVLAQKETTLAMASIKFGGLAETIHNMAVGNRVGVILEHSNVMNYLPGSILVQTTEELSGEFVQKVGETSLDSKLVVNTISLDLEQTIKNYKETLESVFPSTSKADSLSYDDLEQKNPQTLKSEVKIDRPKVVIPVFPGTNSEYDSEKAFVREGALVEQIVIKNLTSKHIQDSIITFSKAIDSAQILFIPGGFSAADEPEGSGKFIATVLKNKKVKQSIENLLDRKGLILGICNGFQALVKSGLLPYGEIKTLEENSPTLFYNEIGRHIAQQVRVKIENSATHSPWLKGMGGKTYWIPVSHGEGNFKVNKETLKELIANNQIAGRYVDLEGNPTAVMPFNPNGSTIAIEGLVSKCGQIYGRMGHPERSEEGLFKNIPNMGYQNIFKNAVEYFTK